jgi:hypothetical protein
MPSVLTVVVLACVALCAAGFPWGRVAARGSASRKAACYVCLVGGLAIIFSAGFQTRTPFLFGLPMLLAGLSWLAGWFYEAFLR